MNPLERIKSKKGQVASLWSFALALVVLGIVLTVGAIILVTLRDTQTANTVGYNLSNAVLNGIETFSDWIPIIVIAGVAGVVLYLVMKYLIPQLRGSSGY